MSIRSLITNNLGWKLLSLLLAAATWLTIVSGFRQDQLLMDSPVETTSKRTFMSIPVSLMTSTTNPFRYRVDPPSVEVDITGPPDALRKLKDRELHIYVDLGAVGDEKQFRRPLQWQCPKGMEISSISQSQVIVERISAGK